MEGYKVTIKEASKELSARERIMMKDTTNAVKIDESIPDNGSLVITPIAFAILEIHNEKAEAKDYPYYVIIDNDGTKYATGSTSLWTAFKEIWDEMENEEETYSIEVYKKDSKNFKGKHFLTCSII